MNQKWTQYNVIYLTPLFFILKDGDDDGLFDVEDQQKVSFQKARNY